MEWLSRLDGLIYIQIMGKKSYSAYDEAKDMDTELLVDMPYDDIYIRWLEAQINYANGEIDKYNSAITMFNTAFEAYENHYHRNHMPLSKGSLFLF